MAKPAAITTSNPTSEKNGSLAEVPSQSAASVLASDEGKTIITQSVVAKLAGMAINEVEGVHSLQPWDAGQQVTLLAKRVMGGTMRDLGVHVEVGTVEAAVDTRIVVEYGNSIVRVAGEIRRNVRDRVEQATGLRVVEVNIEVVDLHFPSSDSPVVPDQPPRVR